LLTKNILKGEQSELFIDLVPWQEGENFVIVRHPHTPYKRGNNFSNKFLFLKISRVCHNCDVFDLVDGGVMRIVGAF
jgi:hypothetical protein